MRLGIHARELWNHKLGVAIALVLALLAAGRTYAGDRFPPGLSHGSPETARAATHLLVDTAHSTVVDLRQETYDLEGLTNRALLVSNAMASLPVRERIAARAGVSAAAISMTTPLNAEYPQSVGGSQPADGSFGSPFEYRLNVLANATVPIVDIDTEAPTEVGAKKLANAAADGLAAYLRTVAKDGATPAGAQVRLIQLGRAQVVPVREGAGIAVALLAFALVFALASATVLFVARVRRGWLATAAKLPTAA
jgi:hypothetical protein